MLRFFNNTNNNNKIKPGFFPIENDTDTKKNNCICFEYAGNALSLSHSLWKRNSNKENNLGFEAKRKVKSCKDGTIAMIGCGFSCCYRWC